MSARTLLTAAASAAAALTLAWASPAAACGKDGKGCHCARHGAAQTSAAGAPAGAATTCDCQKGGKGCTCKKGECACENCKAHRGQKTAS